MEIYFTTEDTEFTEDEEEKIKTSVSSVSSVSSVVKFKLSFWHQLIFLMITKMII